MSSLTSAQSGVLGLVWQSGAMAKAVLLVLCLASVLCWAVILAKSRALRKAKRDDARFLKLFWQAKSLDDIFAKVEKSQGSPVSNLFKHGYKELKKMPTQELRSADPMLLDNVSRSLARASQAEVASLERSIGLLATTASAAPFIGLFGTVWGIMNSFQSIGASGAANLAVVAPGISEALITTATGIGAAIPAVVAYNHFTGQIRRIAVEMDCFSQDFLNIIQRSLLAGRSKG